MGYDGDKLAYTGAAGLTLFGMHLGLDWILAVALALVLIGAMLFRIGAKRRHRNAPQR